MAKPSWGKNDIDRWNAQAATIAFHRKALTFDSLSLNYVLEERYLEGLIQGGVDVTVTTFFIEESWSDTLRIVDRLLGKIEHSSIMHFAADSGDIERAKHEGKIAIVMGSQGSACIGEDFTRLELLKRLGLRSVQFTYTSASLYGDGCGERRNGGLTLLGEEFIDAVNELPIMLDFSHCGHRTSNEGIARATNPVCTHANAYSVHPVDRNKMDDTVRALIGKGGMIGVCMPPRFVGNNTPDLGKLLDHVDHFVKLVGTEHVGTGFDFTEKMQVEKTDLREAVAWRRRRPDIFGSSDEFAARINPPGLKTIRDAPNFTQGLFDRGYGEEDVERIIGKNWLRVFTRICG